eukprot:TRINITY_DN65284_c0_g1_i2.p1 TRINITY_DN65284_c0_g1~~TRINITY_DN65284_c0_g1_i2.p1  ORF type:complete len:310 (-),score=25.51 TRINITY_DN65284_c0_g1_i2:111-1010(-)
MGISKKAQRKVQKGKPQQEDQPVNWLKFTGLLIVAIAVYGYFGLPKGLLNRTIDSTQDIDQSWSFSCSPDTSKVPKCSPRTCGRRVVDGLFTSTEIEALKNLTDATMQYGGGSAGPTIYDVHSGALTKGNQFIDIYQSLKAQDMSSPVQQHHIKLIKDMTTRLRSTIEKEYDVKNLVLTKPTFFSRIQASKSDAANPNDEYWHYHIDKKQYGSFDYTSLIYLNTAGEDFTGGEFEFEATNGPLFVHPKAGRAVMFTSGDENIHRVNKVTSGTRYAFTVAFTCTQSDGITAAEFMNRAAW